MKIEGTNCPVCGLEIHGEIESRGSDAKPKAGDVGVCLHCGVMLTFVRVGDHLERAVMTQVSWEEAAEKVDMSQVERIQRFVRRRNNISSIQS